MVDRTDRPPYHRRRQPGLHARTLLYPWRLVEWAPPCFHFRMPYWEHMKKWLEYIERLSYLTSQGHHVCDILTLYPTETLQAFTPTQTDNYDFSYAQLMSDNGLDYDFIDCRSLRSAKIENQQWVVGPERYRVLILKDIQALPFDILQKNSGFLSAGGSVIGLGQLLRPVTAPAAPIRKSMPSFGKYSALPPPKRPTSPPKYKATSRRERLLSRHYTKPHFSAQTNLNSRFQPRQWRREGSAPPDRGSRRLHGHERQPGTECFFRAKGQVELWNASTGTFAPQTVTRVTPNGTYLRLKAPENRSSLVVFSRANPPSKHRTQSPLPLKPVCQSKASGK